MPRNASGTYTLPSGNPVVSGTLIEADWANTTLNDLANEITDSLSRSGEGGMLAPFRLADGLQASPGIAWLNEPSTGFYREGSGEMWGVVGGAQILQYTATGVLVPAGKTLTANGGTTTTTLTTSGAATLASASVTGNLSVGGTLTLTGGLTLNGNVTVGDSSADTLTINSTITSNLIFTDNTYDIGASGATRPRHLYLAGNGVIGGTLGVSGVLTASGGVTGNLTGNVTGNVTGNISGGTVAGTTGTFSSNVTVGGTLGVTGATTLSSTLGVTGAITASGGVSGNVTGNLTGNVTGSISGGTVAGSTGAFSSNVTVGGTLGVTGVATLTANPVLSGGTANGVLYLNGSKEATSGSGLTFDGARLSIAGGTNGTRFSVKGTGAFGGFDTGAAADGRIEYAYNGTDIFYTGIDSSSLMSLVARSGVSLGFGANGSEGMRLTSTGLGIGTSSPTEKLQVNGGIVSTGAFSGASATGGSVILSFSSGVGSVLSLDPSVAWKNLDIGSAQTTFSISGAEKMRLDSSGNLGLGVTPSAWGTLTALQVKNAFVAGFSNSAYFGANAYYDGSNFKYIASDYAGRYQQSGGNHEFYTAPSGTAGNTISFTQAMTLDASGQLMLGTTTAYNRIHVNGSGEQYIRVGAATNADYRGFVIGAADGDSSAYGQLKMELSGGQMQLVAGAAGFGGFLTIYTNGSERARITSGGNLLVGTTSDIIDSGRRLSVVGGSVAGSFKVASTSEIAVEMWNAATSGDNIFSEFKTEASPTLRGSITYNRTAGLVAYNTTSDVRLKENIADAEEAGSKIDAMQVRQFDWKETGNHLDYGFVAQELHAVAPHAVSKPEDEEAMWSVDYSKLVPMLVKEIQTLRARVAALEAK